MCDVVVVYHATILAIGQEILAYGYFVRPTQLLTQSDFAYYVIQLNDTTNDSFFHMSDGMLNDRYAQYIYP